MIQTDELTGFCLPERLFQDAVSAGIPSQEVVAEQSAGITGVRVQAPVGVVDVMLGHVCGKQLHPLLVLCTVHEAAPFADQQGSDVILVDICPGAAPVIIQQRFFGEVLVEPCLLVNGRTVVMR